MSSNNGLLLRKTNHTHKPYELSEYDAGDEEKYWTKRFKTLEEALKYAQDYMKNNELEYNLITDI